jgi:hypothetical protein
MSLATRILLSWFTVSAVAGPIVGTILARGDRAARGALVPVQPGANRIR